MPINPDNLTLALNQARHYEENCNFDEALKLFLEYYEDCISQNEYPLKSLHININSALKGAMRCFIKLDQIDNAKEMLSKQIDFFKDDYRNPYCALMRSKIEKVMFNLLMIEHSINVVWKGVDDYISGTVFEKMHPSFKKGGRISHYLIRDIGSVVRLYTTIFANDIAKSFLNSVILKVKENLGDNVSWEPQFFSDVAIFYTFIDCYNDAIELNLFAYELTKRYSKNLPKNYRLVEENLYNNLSKWYLILNQFDKSEKWISQYSDSSPEFAGYNYLKMKNYTRARELFNSSIEGKSNYRPFLYELVNFCDLKINNKKNLMYLEKALTRYENYNPKSHPDIGLNILRTYRVRDSIYGLEKERYLSFIDDLKRKCIFKDRKYSPYPLTFYFCMIGICYLKLGDKEFAFKSFDKTREIKKAESCVDAWECEPEYFEVNKYLNEEMILLELYDDKYRKIGTPEQILQLLFTDEEITKYSGQSKKEYFNQGIQADRGEAGAIIKTYI